MKTSKLICVLGALCLMTFAATSVAWAGASAFAGVAMPTGNFGDAAGMGYYLGGSYDMPVAPVASVGVRAAYNRFSWDNDVGGNFNSIEALAFGKVTSPAGPFGMLGLGMSSSGATVEDISADRETNFTMGIGAGYSLTKVEIMAMYHTISADGASVNFLTLSAGLGF